MIRTHLITLMTSICVVLSGCAAHTLFPSQVMEKVAPTFQFEAWRDAPPTNPAGKSDSGLKVELGGRIIQTFRNGKGIVIVAEQLPIVKHPQYGPAEEIKRTGDYEFAFLYPGALEPQALTKGNRFIIVGTTTSRRPVMVNGVSKTEPFLVADCIHVWETGRVEIVDTETTYCVAK